MEDIFSSLSTYGYIILFIYSFGGGMVGLIGASIFSSPIIGEMNIFLSIAVASTSNMLGDMFLFYTGRYHKTEIQNTLKKYTSKLSLTRLLLSKFGIITIFIQKYIYGVKTLVPILYGINTTMSLWKFAFFNFLATMLWGFLVGFSTYILAKDIKEFFEEYSLPFYTPFLAFFILFVSIWGILTYFEKKRIRRKEERRN